MGLNIEGSRIDILNIYAPIDMRRRAAFWSSLTGLLPEMDSWIVGGDFNNLEALEDQQGRGPEFLGIAQAEQSEWDSFLFAMGGRDSWHEPSFCRWSWSLDFSGGYRREGGRLLQRLDRFYVSNSTID